MTYFLEKYYTLDFDNKLLPAPYGHCLIRPCNWDYKDVLDFLNGKMSKKVSLQLDGQIALYNVKNANYYKHLDDSQDFNSIEEWLIWLELTKGISPDFEEVHVCTTYLDDYIVKTIDLHTNEVLYDSVEPTLAKLKTKN